MAPRLFERSEQLTLTAAEVEPGDWTFFTGFRRVVDVTPVEVTHGRGKKKRVYVEAVLLSRVDGTDDRLPVEQELRVLRPPAA